MTATPTTTTSAAVSAKPVENDSGKETVARFSLHAFSHLYKMVCLSVHLSLHRSVRPLVLETIFLKKKPDNIRALKKNDTLIMVPRLSGNGNVLSSSISLSSGALIVEHPQPEVGYTTRQVKSLRGAKQMPS